MDESTPETLHTEKGVSEYFQIETHILSSRSADAYKAVDRSRNTPVCLWMLRHPLAVNSDAVRRFLDRMTAIDQIDPPVADTLAFGVDAGGTAFSLFPPLDGFTVVSGNIEPAEAERRFTACLRLISRLHASGTACGDLCGSSFWVRRDGEIRFLGIMGSFDVEAAATAMSPPLDTIPYIAPEQRGGSIVSPAADVFALGVLGYRLLTGKYPYGEGVSAMTSPCDPSTLPKISTLVGVPPVWAEEILKRCLSPDPESRFRNAGEVLEQVSEIRKRVFSEETSPVLKNRSASAVTVRAKASSGAQQFKNLPQRPVAQSPAVQASSTRAYVVGVVLIAGLLAFLLPGVFKNDTDTSTSQLKSALEPHRQAADEKTREAIDVLSSEQRELQEKLAQIREIELSDDPLAHDILIKSAREAELEEMRKASEEAIIKRAKRLGLPRSAEQVFQWLRTLRSNEYPSSYEAMLKSIDKSLPAEARFASLRQAYASHPRVALRLAVALALDLNALGAFQPVISQLVGDSLQLKDIAKFSTLSLILAHPDLALVFGEDVIQKKELIPDEDIIWLLKQLASRNDINVRPIANIAVERKVLSPLRTVFLQTLRDRGDLPPDILTALIRAAAGVLRSEDITAFGRWYDISAEAILLAVCALEENPALAIEAFDTLAGKSLVVEPSASLVQWVRKSYWDERGSFARVVGMLGNLELLSDEEVIVAFESFDRAVRDSDLLDILLDTNHPMIVRFVVGRYSELLGLGTLLNLLSNRDPDVRIAAVRSLKSFNDIGALKIIIDHYENEDDERVKSVYRETFWVIRQREESGDVGMGL